MKRHFKITIACIFCSSIYLNAQEVNNIIHIENSLSSFYLVLISLLIIFSASIWYLLKKFNAVVIQDNKWSKQDNQSRFSTYLKSLKFETN
jgi:hypothetical protein